MQLHFSQGLQYVSLCFMIVALQASVLMEDRGVAVASHAIARIPSDGRDRFGSRIVQLSDLTKDEAEAISTDDKPAKSPKYSDHEYRGVKMTPLELCERLNIVSQRPPTSSKKLVEFWKDTWGMCLGDQSWVFCVSILNVAEPETVANIRIVKEVCPPKTVCRMFRFRYPEPLLSFEAQWRVAAHCVERDRSSLFVTNPDDSQVCTSRSQYLSGGEPQKLFVSGQATSPFTHKQVRARDLYFEIATSETGILHRLRGDIWKDGLVTAAYTMTTRELYVRFCMLVDPIRPGSNAHPVIELLGGGIFASQVQRAQGIEEIQSFEQMRNATILEM